MCMSGINAWQMTVCQFLDYNCAQFQSFLIKPEKACLVQEISKTEKYGSGWKENESDL